MRAEILAVGTELLLGNIVNTNAQYIAKRLADLGIEVYHQAVIGDNPKRLMDAYTAAFKRADLVITTGGLGPTKDDLTK
ncbi:MAG: molybdopterin-binding protein, partial [Clostridiaceae bacterium]